MQSETRECKIPPEEAPEVAIIIVNYNGKDLLEKYLPSITELDYPELQIIIVDNNSDDDSVEFLEREFPDIRVVESETNGGLSKGNNVGVEVADDTEYIWFLNPDVRVPQDSLSHLIKHMESNSEVGVSVPRINEMDSETIQSLGYHYDVTGRSYRRYEGQDEPPVKDPDEVPYGMLASLLVSRDVWDDVGGFDEKNFIYGDDDYICLQAWLRGHHVEVVPESVVYHEGGASKAPSKFDVYHNVLSRTRCYLKTLQLRSIAIGFPFFVGQIGAQALKDVLVRKSPKVAYSRISGFTNAITELPQLYRDRQKIQDERVYPDSRFLSGLFEE